MTRFTLLLPAALLAGWAVAAAAPPGTNAPGSPAKPDSADAQDIVYFGDGRPVLIRAHVEIDGKPLGAAWDAFIDKLFKQLDGEAPGRKYPADLLVHRIVERMEIEDAREHPANFAERFQARCHGVSFSHHGSHWRPAL